MMSREVDSLIEDPNNSNTSDSRKTETSEKDFGHYRALILSECGYKITTTESYLRRLQSLRKELNYLKETEWMYEPLDKKPTL